MQDTRIRTVAAGLCPPRGRGSALSGIVRLGKSASESRFVAGLAARVPTAPKLSSAAADDAQGVAVSKDGRLTVLLEGNLVNRVSLRAQLKDRGHEFQTGDDAEIALGWFLEDDVAAFDRLDGAFALAIYDRLTEALLLVRDRAGQMPLHYHVEGAICDSAPAWG